MFKVQNTLFLYSECLQQGTVEMTIDVKNNGWYRFGTRLIMLATARNMVSRVMVSHGHKDWLILVLLRLVCIKGLTNHTIHLLALLGPKTVQLKPKSKSHNIVLSYLILYSSTKMQSDDPEVKFIAKQMNKHTEQQQGSTAAQASIAPPRTEGPNPAQDGSRLPDRIVQEQDPEVKFIMKHSFQQQQK